MSTPSTRPPGPTASAKASVVAPAPQPMSSTASPGTGAVSASSRSVTPACMASRSSARVTQTRPGSAFQ